MIYFLTTGYRVWEMRDFSWLGYESFSMLVSVNDNSELLNNTMVLMIELKIEKKIN